MMRRTTAVAVGTTSLNLLALMTTLLIATNAFTPQRQVAFLRHHCAASAVTPHRFFSSRLSASLSEDHNDENCNNDNNLSPIPTEWQGEVLSVLKAVIDPDLQLDIVTLGFVQNLRLDPATRLVSLDLQLTTPACPVKDMFVTQCKHLVQALAWTRDVAVTLTAKEPMQHDVDALLSGLSQVGAIISVSSCKGGVGKSTTAVNLAYAIQSLGATVGILDADVYGPSLPTMVRPDDDIVRFVGRQIAPLQRNGIRLMSFGYVNDGSAVMRGPMVTQLLDQFLSVTQWGALDYLILDMPPGTGDIPLTLTQRLNITAAVIVTTPQELSFADVVRGVEMMDTVQVPCVAVVENMAYYPLDWSTLISATTSCLDESVDGSNNKNQQLQSALVSKLVEYGLLPADAATKANGGTTRVNALANDLVQVLKTHLENQSSQEPPLKLYLFGPGHKRRLSEQWGIEHTFSMPLLEQIATNGDSGTPYVLENPNSPAAKLYQDLAAAVVTEVAKIQHAGAAAQRLAVEYNAAEHVLLLRNHGCNEQIFLSPAELRRNCRCAACVEELTGRQLLVTSAIRDTIKPRTMNPCGNYALSVDWSDGHRSLYPYRQIWALVGKQRKPQQQAAPANEQEPQRQTNEEMLV